MANQTSKFKSNYLKCLKKDEKMPDEKKVVAVEKMVSAMPRN